MRDDRVPISDIPIEAVERSWCAVAAALTWEVNNGVRTRSSRPNANTAAIIEEVTANATAPAEKYADTRAVTSRRAPSSSSRSPALLINGDPLLPPRPRLVSVLRAWKSSMLLRGTLPRPAATERSAPYRSAEYRYPAPSSMGSRWVSLREVDGIDVTARSSGLATARTIIAISNAVEITAAREVVAL